MQFELRCDAVVNDKDKPPSFQAAMRFATDIRFRANGTDVDLGIGADFVNTPGQIQFYIKPNQAVKAGLAELRSLMHGADLGKIIPSDFHLEDIIELNNIVLQVDPLARKLTSVLIGIKTAQGWSILHDPKIAVDSVELVFRLNDPMDVNNFAKNLELAFFGEIAIGSDGKLDVSAVYPGFEFSGELKPGTNIDLAQVATHFISDAADVPSIKVTEFNFDVAPSTKAYSVSVTVDSDWKIPLGSTHLQIGEVKLLIDHPQPSVTNAEVGGWLTIAGGTLKVDWKLPGDFQLAGTLPTIHLDQIISELSADKLRADFPAIVLENSQVYVERRSDSSFYFALGTMVENFGAIELEFIEANKQTGFVFGFLLPGAWSLANLTEVFDPLKFLQFKDASMIVSSIDDPNFQFRSFTEPNFNFPPQPPSAPAGVKKGLSLYAELLIGTGGLEVLANLLKGLDGMLDGRFDDRRLRQI